MVATKPAEGVPLLPYLEHEEEGTVQADSPPIVVLPLPPDRSRLRRVDLWLAIATAATGQIAEQQHVVFDRYTTGDALRFYLPKLPIGTYEATLRTLALVDSIDASGAIAVREVEDRASLPIEITAGERAPAEETVQIQFFFPKGQDQITDASETEQVLQRIQFVLQRLRVRTAQLDCWASAEGPRQLNFRLTERRCAWLKNLLTLRISPPPPFQVVAHGADDPPVQEPAGSSPQALEEARRKNRVAVLQLVVYEDAAHPSGEE